MPLARESDMSIVVCQVIAMRAARNIGIRVPRSTIDRAARYVVDSAVTEDDHQPGFRHPAYRERDRDLPLPEGQLLAHVLRADRGGCHGAARPGDLLQRADPQGDRLPELRARPLQRDVCAQRALFLLVRPLLRRAGHVHAGRPGLAQLLHQLRQVLLDVQHPDGSWPNDDGPGPPYGTATAVLILEIPYGLLPIFQR